MTDLAERPAHLGELFPPVPVSGGLEGTREGLADAAAAGRMGGRPTVVDAELLASARCLLPDPERSVESIAELLGVGALYNHVPDLKERRVAGRTAIGSASGETEAA